MSLGCGIILCFLCQCLYKIFMIVAACALARLSLFADGGNDTKVIRLSRTRPGKLHSSKHRILGLITLSPLLSPLSPFSRNIEFHPINDK